MAGLVYISLVDQVSGALSAALRAICPISSRLLNVCSTYDLPPFRDVA